jgi:uncharacterized protein (TIGR02217 family)
MTTPPSFPVLTGQGWSVHKKPAFSTIVASHVSGREVRDALYDNPIWHFELTFDGLDSTGATYPSLGAQSLQTLMGLFLECQGQYQTFLYTDPTDSVATAVQFAVGDGTTTSFTLARYMGSFLEPVGWVLAVSHVYLNGVDTPAAGAWSLTSPNTLVFVNAPASGVSIAASFSYAFQCRFDSDDLDFEQFMANLWSVDSLKFKSVRTS